MNKTTEKDKPNLPWQFFSSVRLTISLLIILAIASISGTVIPQQGQGAIEFARKLSPEMFRFLSFLDLFDMYHSLWFRILLGCLTFNIIICSVDRFPAAWKRFRAIPRPDRDKPFEDLPPLQAFLVKGKLKESADKVEQLFRSRYKKIQKKETADRYFFYGQKGRFSHFGVYLVHLSVVLILIGGLAGSFFGFEAYVNIVEGEEIDTVTLRKKMSPLKLDFGVRLDNFTVQFYENGAPKEYRSVLSFIVDGKTVEKKNVLVNHPVQFRGVTFYQSTYGKVPGKKVRLKIHRPASPLEITSLDVETRKSVPLPGKEGQFSVVKVSTNLMGMMGPAVLISVRPEQGDETSFWVFRDQEKILKRFPDLMSRNTKLNSSAFKPYTFFLDGLDAVFYTGLQVNRDPGVSIVWTGFFLIIAGFFVAFFSSHRKIWVRLIKSNGELDLSLAGTSNKNPVGLKRELEHLTENLKDLF